ncbi:MAG TPA: transporter [Planctomycetaceae bacterium]|nr:transporter [Planctomycetaceae bacterium]
MPVQEQWKAHVEYFGLFSQNREDERGRQYLSPGIHYLVTPDFQVGIRVGWGLNADSSRFFSNIGAGVRF